MKVMSRSAFPSALSTLMTCTPMAEPNSPPTRHTAPILKSTFFRRKWAATPDADVATMALVSDAAATVGGTPIIIRIGVIRKPPPTPSSPDMKPTTAPTDTSRAKLIDMPAIGSRMGDAATANTTIKRRSFVIAPPPLPPGPPAQSLTDSGLPPLALTSREERLQQRFRASGR